MKIRNLIREVISRVIHEEDILGGDISGTIKDIGSQLDLDLKNMDNIVKTQKADLNNTDNQIKSKLQLRSKLTATSPERKGLEREVPEAQKGLKIKQQQLKDLENAQKGMSQAKIEIEKQRQEMQKQAISGGKTTTSNILPSLQSPI